MDLFASSRDTVVSGDGRSERYAARLRISQGLNVYILP